MPASDRKRRTAEPMKASMRMWLRNRHTGVMEDGTAILEYDPADPWAVRLVFVGREDEPWHFARDLLAVGLVEHAGYGDVRMWRGTGPRGDVLTVVLHGTDLDEIAFDGLLELPADSVHRFLDRTFRRVSRGTEADHIDLDRLVARLLAETS